MSNISSPMNYAGSLSKVSHKQTKLSQKLEQAYRTNQLKLDLDLFRYLAVLGMVLYGGFYIADCYVIQTDRLLIHQIVRLMIVLPMSIIVIGMSYKKAFYTNYQLIELSILGSLVIGQFFHIFLSLDASIPAYYYLTITMMLVLWGNAFPFLRFSIKLFFTIINLIFLPMFLFYYVKSDLNVIAYQIVFYLALSTVSLVSAYLNEMSRRNNFLKAQRLTKNARGFNKVAQVTAHELKTSMRVINGLSYIIEKDEKEKLSPKSIENLELIQEHIGVLNKNLEELREHAVQSLN